MCPPESSSRAGPRALVAQHLVAHSVVIDRGCDKFRTNMTAAMYAAAEMGPAITGSQFSGITVHPGEDASAKEEDDWWRIFDGVLSSMDAVHYIAGNEPPRLAHLLPVDNTGYTEVTVPADDTDPSYISRRSSITARSRRRCSKMCVAKPFATIASGSPPNYWRQLWIRLCVLRRLLCYSGYRRPSVTRL